jgi:hypothetical protein
VIRTNFLGERLEGEKVRGEKTKKTNIERSEKAGGEKQKNKVARRIEVFTYVAYG